VFLELVAHSYIGKQRTDRTRAERCSMRLVVEQTFYMVVGGTDMFGRREISQISVRFARRQGSYMGRCC